ncbi:hypothetical protein TRFO_24842 [Tritrichomonas foetus]|uniref:Uncharacterized protein n=1 Tax=Tritrichomonas foetus TaxID=1144522 RepID=A0A1J4KB93_9EUKA|nr:hypothetical protein TRFO_24842 [Tritrichomonas foetus]|eukprot:OHT06966.1 hypothetical protein TRFO_24842 [Tritrichomonas foetus]
MMISTSSSGRSVIIEGPKDSLNKLKKKLQTLLHSPDEIGENVFIELQTVFKSLGPSSCVRTTSDIMNAHLNKEKVIYTNRAKEFLKKLGHNQDDAKEDEDLTIPEIPRGNLTLDEVKAKFGFKEIRSNVYEILIPDELSQNLLKAKRMMQNGENVESNRFSCLEDPADEQSILYNFDHKIDPKNVKNNTVVVRRSGRDKDEAHFIYTSLRLLRLYERENEGPVLNKFKRRVSNYLKNIINSNSYSEPFDPLKVPEFHTELIGKDILIPPVEHFTKFPVKLPIFETTFLIETFCEFQDKKHKCNFSKEFLDHKTIYLLSLLAPLPVALEYNNYENTATMTFADCSIPAANQNDNAIDQTGEVVSAEFIYNQVSLAVNCFSRLPKITATFHNVDSFYFMPGNLFKISDQLDMPIVRGLDNNINGVSASFVVWAVPSSPNDPKIEELNQFLKEQYDLIQLYFCDQCKKPYSKGFGGECSLTEHCGEQVRFDDGLLEHSTPSLDGDIITVKYTCCGEVQKFSPGCNDMVFPFGHQMLIDPASHNGISSSQFLFQVA